MDFCKKLGLNLKQIREANDLTQEKLAELSNLSIPTIARLETGKNFLTLKTAQKLSKCLDVTLEDLFNVHNIKSYIKTKRKS